MSLTWTALSLYYALFAYCTYRTRRDWLYRSAMVCLLAGLLGAYALRGAWALPAALYHPYFYIALAGLPLLARGEAVATDVPLVRYWLVTTLMQHAAFLLLLVFAWLYYPRGTSALALLSLAQLYILHPVWWITAQAVLMLMLHLNSRHETPTTAALGRNMRAIFLSALVMITVYVMHDMVRLMAR